MVSFCSLTSTLPTEPQKWAFRGVSVKKTVSRRPVRYIPTCNFCFPQLRLLFFTVPVTVAVLVSETPYCRSATRVKFRLVENRFYNTSNTWPGLNTSTLLSFPSPVPTPMGDTFTNTWQVYACRKMPRDKTIKLRRLGMAYSMMSHKDAHLAVLWLVFQISKDEMRLTYVAWRIKQSCPKEMNCLIFDLSGFIKKNCTGR